LNDALLDVEILLDAQQGIVQHLRWGECDYGPFVQALAERHGLVLSVENLALPSEPAAAEEESHGGCGQPNCGRVSGSGCTSCASGGGCSSCGTGKVDMTAYFAHLRTQMEARNRVPLPQSPQSDPERACTR
jgi:uncharacterized membrane protein